jgi:hypothetical protein
MMPSMMGVRQWPSSYTEHYNGSANFNAKGLVEQLLSSNSIWTSDPGLCWLVGHTGIPKRRQMVFPDCPSGRVFDDELLQQLIVIPFQLASKQTNCASRLSEPKTGWRHFANSRRKMIKLLRGQATGTTRGASGRPPPRARKR